VLSTEYSEQNIVTISLISKLFKRKRKKYQHSIIILIEDLYKRNDKWKEPQRTLR